jgi:predicted alpha/beta hydrolase
MLDIGACPARPIRNQILVNGWSSANSRSVWIFLRHTIFSVRLSGWTKTDRQDLVGLPDGVPLKER